MNKNWFISLPVKEESESAFSSQGEFLFKSSVQRAHKFVIGGLYLLVGESLFISFKQTQSRGLHLW